MKNCYKCGESKPLSEFQKCAAKKSGLSVWCKQCYSLWNCANVLIRKRGFSKADAEQEALRRLHAKQAGLQMCWKCKRYDKPEHFTSYKRTGKSRVVVAVRCLNCRRDADLKRDYKITQTELNTLNTIKQCQICDRTFRSRKDRHIDHCHSSGRVRGILCANCNAGIGQLKDSPDLLVAAFMYLNDPLPGIGAGLLF